MRDEQDLDQQIRAMAEQIYEESEEVLAVMVRGSYVKKTMTTTSDIDLYAVTRTTGPSSEFRQRGSVLFHLRFVPLAHLQWELRRCEPRFLGFVFHGHPVVDPSGIFQSLEAIVNTLPTKETLQRLSSEGRHQYEDAVGQLQNQNYRASIQLARDAATAYMKTLLFAAGIKCFKGKDVLNDLERLNGHDDLKHLYFRILGLESVKRSYADELLQAVNTLYRCVEEYVLEHHRHSIVEDPPTSW